MTIAKYGISQGHMVLTKMNNKITIILILILLPLIFSCYPKCRSQEKTFAPFLTEKEKQWIKENPIIKCGGETNWPPFDFVDEFSQQYEGVADEYLKLIEKKSGLRIKVITGYSWNQLLEKMKQGEFDMLPCLYYSEARSKYINFTKPYLSVRQFVFVRIKDSRVNDLSDLKGKKIAGVKGFATNQEILQKFNNQVELLVFDSIYDALSAVITKKADAYIGSYAVTSHVINKKYLSNSIKPLTPAGLPSNSLHMGTRKDLPILRDILQKTIEQINFTEKERIRKQWFLPEQSRKLILNRREKAWINDHPIIKFTGDPSFAPVEFIDSKGRHNGISQAYLDVISDKTGLQFEFKKTSSWVKAKKALAKSEVDILPATMTSQERRRYANFTQAYISTNIVIFSTNKNHFAIGLEQLAGKKVSVVEGYYIHEILKTQHPEIILETGKTPKKAMELLLQGKVDAFVGNILTSSYYIGKLGYQPIRVVGETQYSMDLGIAVRKDLPVLREILNKALSSIQEETHNEIQRKWLTVSYYKQTDYILILEIVGIALLGLAFFLFWNRKLALEIKKRKLIEKRLQEEKLKAEAAVVARSAFLANMSHEIRTPLHSIMGFLEMSLEDPELKEPHLDHLTTAFNSAKGLLKIINDILDLSKLGSGKLELKKEVFNINKLINSVINIFKNDINPKQVELKLTIDKSVKKHHLADPGRLKQVLVNLLGNAVKFTEKGEISIKVSQEQNKLFFVIKDTGIGIKKDKQKTIFEPFIQADESTTRRFSGTGLGTAISKQFIELMGGEISLKSTIGKGSTFSFYIITEEAPAIDYLKITSRWEKRDKIDPNRKFRILLAEDVEVNIKLAKKWFGKRGHNVEVAANGALAIQQLETKDFDIVLMDVHMPVMDGMEATHKIRQAEQKTHKHTPIIALTASVMKDEREKYFEAGMDEVVAKPINFKELLKTIGNLVDSSKS